MKNPRLSLPDFLIINLPVIPALLIAAAGTFCAVYFRPRLPLFAVIILAAAAWQGLCAAVMLLIDYKRKKAVFLRIIRASSDNKKMKLMLRPLKGTLCGYSVGLAVKNRFPNRKQYLTGEKE